MAMGRMVEMKEYLLYGLISWFCDTMIVIGLSVDDDQTMCVTLQEMPLDGWMVIHRLTFRM